MLKLTMEKGTVTVSNAVFTTITGAAATACFGVKGMADRSVKDGLVHLLRREAMAKGVKVNFSEDGSVVVELHIIVENGVNIPTLSKEITNQVRYTVENCTGAKVDTVDVFVESMTL